MVNRIWVLLIPLFQYAAASACELDDITAALEPEISYAYRQEKQIAGLDRRLLSSGTLQLEQEELWMRQEKPLESSTLFSANGMTQFNAAGEALLQVDDPLVAHLSSVFLALYQGHLQQLEEAFVYELDCQLVDEEGILHWQLELLPQTDNLKNILDYIDVRGSTGIETIRFRETRGDLTTITIMEMASADTSID